MKALLNIILAVLLLSGTAYSEGTLDKAYVEIIEVEVHVHSYECWFGVAAAPSASNRADRINPDSVPFTADAHNDIWGNWLAVLGSADTPCRSGKTRFDLHRIFIVSVERNTAMHFIQIGVGDSATIVSGERYTTVLYEPPTVQAEAAPIVVQMPRFTAGDDVWLRVCVPDQDTGELLFYIGIHEYDE